MKRLLLVFLLPPLFALSACTTSGSGSKKFDKSLLPETFSLYNEEPLSQKRWWNSFESVELNNLIEKALSGNFTLKEAIARLVQAEALAVQAGASKLPGLSLTAGASQGKQKSSLSTDAYSVGLASSYEIDLWGRIDSQVRKAGLTVLASREDFHAAAITLSGEVTELWIKIISQRKERELLDKQLTTTLTMLELVELRFSNSMATLLDVYQQREAVAGTRAAIPLAEASEGTLLNKMALFMGKASQADINISNIELPSIESLPATGIPSDLLEMRPDIRAAGLRLHASKEQVKVARASRLPSISLSANAGYNGGSFSKIFDNWLVNLAANLTAPLFDGERLKAEVDRTKAVSEERLAAYSHTVLTAIKEVEDALIREEKEHQHLEALERQYEITVKALNEARKRYMNGLNDYLPVLTELTALQNVERALIRSRRDLVLYRIALHRALGGTWMKELEQTANSKKVKLLAYKVRAI